MPVQGGSSGDAAAEAPTMDRFFQVGNTDKLG
jgi:hypothetical protein